MSSISWLILLATAALGAVVLWEPIREMVATWFGSPEYSHGVLIPVIAAFLVWQRKEELGRSAFTGSWAGVGLVVAGALLCLVGHLATVFVIQQYALVLVIYGIILSFTGWSVFRKLWVPLLILLFMVPLPRFVLANFSSQLQLASSEIGVWVIRLFGISVYREGNVIDLGAYKLQVAEACDGLRYLFPLMTLGFIMAYFFKAALWKRLLVFLSSIPITILMNSFRIGVIGVTVEYWGVGMAEGFLHDFQGWVVFMASAALMLGEMVLLSRIGSDHRSWRDSFSIDLPPLGSQSAPAHARTVPVTLVAAAAVMAAFAVTLQFIPARAEAIPVRGSFGAFPPQLGVWRAREDVLEPVYLQVLRLNDYYLADYTQPGMPGVNMYVAWYDSQRAGQSAHSPRSCIPGGGWKIVELGQRELPDVQGPQGPLRVNRALVSFGNQQQVVYYWFQQRGRIITNEYAVKVFLFWDALTRNRTDGAMVRLTTTVAKDEDPTKADERLAEFAALAVPQLSGYIPE